MARLTGRGYRRTWTHFDDESQNFHRYVKMTEESTGGKRPLKIIFDVFTQTVPSVVAEAGIHVVEPNFLLSLYGVKHGSGACFSVQIANALIARGIDPSGRAEMADFHPFLCQA